jgi:hypothetical protein
MRDVNTALLKAYFIAFDGITYNSVPVPSYSGIMPDNINPNNYILFGEVSNNDLSTKGSADTNTLMRVTIHTFDEKYNSPIIVNSIANEVFQRVYANSQFNLSLDDDLQIYSTELVSDITQHLQVDNSRAYIDRIIIFRHKIFIR